MFISVSFAELLQLFFDLVNQGMDALSSRVHDDVRDFTVQGVALCKKFSQFCLGIGSLQQGAVFVVTGALPQIFYLCAQVDHRAVAAEVVAILLAQYRATPGRQHDVSLSGKLLDDRRFTGSETGLSFQFENQGDFDPGALFDFMIGVDKWPVEVFGDQLAYRGFARAHQPD